MMMISLEGKIEITAISTNITPELVINKYLKLKNALIPTLKYDKKLREEHTLNNTLLRSYKSCLKSNNFN